MKNDNRGVTLIELIVVMLIITVLAGGALFGVQSLDSGNAQSSVKRINALLDYVRLQNMSKQEAYYLILEEDSGAYFVKIQSRVTSGGSEVSKDILTERLKLKNGSITYYSKGTASDAVETEHIISAAPPEITLEVSFLKDSGALRASSGASPSYVKRIVVSSSGRTYTIQLVTMTGMHYIE